MRVHGSKKASSIMAARRDDPIVLLLVVLLVLCSKKTTRQRGNRKVENRGRLVRSKIQEAKSKIQDAAVFITNPLINSFSRINQSTPSIMRHIPGSHHSTMPTAQHFLTPSRANERIDDLNLETLKLEARPYKPWRRKHPSPEVPFVSSRVTE
jgi:type II secretory pathway pseudopilin PulG